MKVSLRPKKITNRPFLIPRTLLTEGEYGSGGKKGMRPVMYGQGEEKGIGLGNITI
jgi:hypothetical protein